VNGTARLDMRFSETQKFSAYELINTYSQKDLERIFINYAEFTPKKA
jgi:16S rRNA C1402 N4-methylase RsmH